MRRNRLPLPVLIFTVLVGLVPWPVQADTAASLDAAHELFYNGRYADAAAAAAPLCSATVAGLAACELRTSAIHFVMRRAMGDGTDRKKAFAGCAECPALLATFVTETERSVAVARTHMKSAPEDQDTLLLLGRLTLNYVWLHLGTLGRKTGWDAYWEARRSLDKVLKMNAQNIRAKVARGWIDYIVDTRMPAGTRWLLGGGNRKRGLQAVREAAAADGTSFVRAEAGFALWDMQVREKDLDGARVTAATLAGDFPDNPELRKFLAPEPALVSGAIGQ